MFKTATIVPDASSSAQIEAYFPHQSMYLDARRAPGAGGLPGRRVPEPRMPVRDPVVR